MSNMNEIGQMILRAAQTTVISKQNQMWVESLSNFSKTSIHYRQCMQWADKPPTVQDSPSVASMAPTCLPNLLQPSLLVTIFQTPSVFQLTPLSDQRSRCQPTMTVETTIKLPPSTYISDIKGQHANRITSIFNIYGPINSQNDLFSTMAYWFPDLTIRPPSIIIACKTKLLQFFHIKSLTNTFLFHQTGKKASKILQHVKMSLSSLCTLSIFGHL